MTTARRDGLVFLVLLAFFSGLLYGAHRYVGETSEKKNTLQDLGTQNMALERQLQMQMRQIVVFKKSIAQLEGYQMKIPENEVDFYSLVQQEMTRNGVRSNVVKPVNVEEGRRGVQIDFEGPYYSFVRTLADWRDMKVAVRLTSVVLNSVENGNAKGVAVIQSVLRK